MICEILFLRINLFLKFKPFEIEHFHLYQRKTCHIRKPIPPTTFESPPKKTFLHKIRVDTLKMLSATIAYLGPAGNHLVVWGRRVPIL